MTILIVEDKIQIQEILTELLENEYHIITTNSGLDAIEILKIIQINLIITDMGIDDISGWQLIEKIRETNKEIKILATSTELPFLELALKLGANDYFLKNSSLQSIKEKISQLLSN